MSDDVKYRIRESEYDALVARCNAAEAALATARETVERLREALRAISQLDPMNRAARAADQAIGIAEAALTQPAAPQEKADGN